MADHTRRMHMVNASIIGSRAALHVNRCRGAQTTICIIIAPPPLLDAASGPERHLYFVGRMSYHWLAYAQNIAFLTGWPAILGSFVGIIEQ